MASKQSLSQEFYNRLWDDEKTAKEDQEIMSLRKEAIDFSMMRLGDISEKRILEIGCGAGFQTAEFVKSGAEVTAIDYSQNSIKRTKKMLENYDYPPYLPAKIIQMDAEEITLPPNDYDFIYINSVLMHTNKEKVIKNCFDLLKDGGSLVLIEPLAQNFIFWAYRTFISKYRKTSPKYLRLSDLKGYESLFKDITHKEFYLVSSFILPFYNNKSRLMKKLRKDLVRLDSFIAKNIPFCRRFFWITVAELKRLPR
jgi:2-polyprenyl-3-methyl-5-hydroxy-6-metoxy-1,4-benzoquinol methylase